jgi:hypothetical protein
MTWLSRILARFPGQEPFREAAGTTIDADDDAWRPLGRDLHRDLAPMTQTRMRELAVYLWESNRLANRLVELPLAYLLAEGVSLTADDPEAADWLRTFWLDPINRLDRKLEPKMRALALFGEQCWPVFVNEVSGAVRLGYLDPALIDKVITDPENGEQPIVVVARRLAGLSRKPSACAAGSGSGASARGDRRLYRVVLGGDEDDLFPEGSGARKLRDAATDGDCFYFRINDLPNSRHGRSDLLSAIDWADVYERMLFGEADRATVIRSAVWDVTLKGATAEQVQARAGEIDTPRPLSVRVHNDAEEWQALTPQLGAGDASDAARLIRTHILGGSTIPEHWYGSGGDVNRATAGEMGEPAEKVLTLRQNWWKGTLADVAVYVLRKRLEAAGRDPANVLADPAWRPRVVFPELVAKDTTKYAAALAQIASACVILIDRGLLSEETALSLIAAVAGRLGVAIDAKEELEKARNAAEERAAAQAESDAFTLPPDDPDADDAPPGGDA